MAAVAKPVNKDSTAAPTVDAKPKGTSCASLGRTVDRAGRSPFRPLCQRDSRRVQAPTKRRRGPGYRPANKADRRSTPRRQRRLTQRAPLPAAGDRCRGGLGGHCGRSAVGDIRLAVVVALARGLRGLGGLVATAKSCGGLGSAFGFGRLRRSVAPLPMAPIAGRRPGILCPIGAADAGCLEATAVSGMRRQPQPPPSPFRVIPVGDRTGLEVRLTCVRDGSTWRKATVRLDCRSRAN